MIMVVKQFANLFYLGLLMLGLKSTLNMIVKMVGIPARFLNCAYLMCFVREMNSRMCILVGCCVA